MAKNVNIKAGRLLTRFIRQIAEEQTEFVKDDDGEDRMVSKAEAMARQMWQIALGWTEVRATVAEAPIEVVHAPDPKMMQLLLDRMEGRAATATEDETFRPSTAKKVSEQARKRIAEAGGLDAGHTSETVT